MATRSEYDLGRGVRSEVTAAERLRPNGGPARGSSPPQPALTPGAQTPPPASAGAAMPAPTTSRTRSGLTGERVRSPTTGLHAAPVMTPTPNTQVRLGRYQVISRLATGGMAEVYLAVHGELSGFRTPV